MKHPFWDRLLLLLCALCAFCGTAGIVLLLLDKVSLAQVTGLLGRIDLANSMTKAIAIATAIILALIGLLLISAMLPAKKKRSSNFAVQHNENGMVRISLKAIEALVQKCLGQHSELKVMTSSLFSDEESIRVDAHIALQSDISMPLAVSALQKQIKRYIEACSGVNVKEVRVFVDSTIPATADTPKSPYVIPEALLGTMNEPLPEKTEETAPEAAEEATAEAPAAVEEQPAEAAEPEAQQPEEAEEA